MSTKPSEWAVRVTFQDGGQRYYAAPGTSYSEWTPAPGNSGHRRC